MRTRRGTGNGMAKRNERDSALFQIIHYGLTFWTVGLNRNVDAVAVIKAHLFMGCCLTVGTDRQRSSETLLKE